MLGFDQSHHKKGKEEISYNMGWIIGLWFLMGTFLLCWWFLFMKKKKNKVKMNKKKGKVPRGNKGWPLLGETLDFIACGYTSNPVSFMEKRKSL